MYTDCIIHLTGTHPKRPWPTARKSVPESIQHLIKHKARVLDRLRTDVERDLLLVNLSISGTRGRAAHAPNPIEHSEVETWLTVQAFRDEIARHIHDVDKHPSSQFHWGKLYRGIHKGSLVCLETETVRKLCAHVMKMEGKDFHEDMVKLRASAAKAVERLAVNNLMIEPDANAVGYLACVKVENADVPWLAAGVKCEGSR